MIYFFEFYGQPEAKPRMNRKSIWYHQKYWDYFNSLRDYLYWQKTKEKIKMIESDIKIEKLKFYREGKKRVDIDNLQKTLFDALQKATIIKNDNLIISISNIDIIYSVEKPKVEFEIIFNPV